MVLATYNNDLDDCVEVFLTATKRIAYLVKTTDFNKIRHKTSRFESTKKVKDLEHINFFQNACLYRLIRYLTCVEQGMNLDVAKVLA